MTAKVVIDDSSTIPPLNITERGTVPSAPNTGDIYLDDGTNTASTNPGWRRYNGSAWEDIGALSGGGSSLPVADTTAIVKGSVDDTKLVRIEADGITTGTTRVATMPDADITLGTDSNAIHNNVAAEISVITEKVSPASADFILIEDSADSNNKKRVQVGNLPTGSGMTSFDITGDTGTPETVTNGETVDIAGGTGIDTSVGVSNQVTVAIDATVATLTGSQTLTNKTINGTNNTITNIGHAEIEADLINGATVENTIDTANDTILFYDNSATALRKTAITNIGGGSGLYTSLAILWDEKTSGTEGGSASAATWNARDLNTEGYDPDAIVSIASNQFTPISGDYHIIVHAPCFDIGRHRLRLYNVTGAVVVQEGLGNSTGTLTNVAHLSIKFTANGTDAYRVDHYSQNAQLTNGLGLEVSDGSPEIYTVIELRKLA